jgi:hypothetical protein
VRELAERAWFLSCLTLGKMLRAGRYSKARIVSENGELLVRKSRYGTSIRLDADGTLVLPYLAGETLATVLEHPASGDAVRDRSIELAVAALAELHGRGFTHADAMAENVMIDLEAGIARWFDFETVHDPSRPQDWRRADDVRALLATCLVRTSEAKLAETLQLILDVYGDDRVTRLLSPSFTSVLRRPLTFHLGQAGLSFEAFRQIARLLPEARG